ncbi:unnamed protein product [Diamesa hyperborea]
MNMLLKSFVVACLVNCAIAQIAPVNPCSAIDGAVKTGFVIDPSACEKYFSCVAGVAFNATCKSPLVFVIDAITKAPSCTAKTATNCLPCRGVGISKVQDPAGCDKWILCNGLVEVKQTCAAGTLFNSAIGGCDLKEKSSCDIDPCTSDATVPDETSCRNWILCINGVELKQECDAGTAFDPTVRGCVPSANVNCPSTDPCSGAPDGFVADPVSCSNFILCISGIKDSTLTCQPTLQFDHISRRCVLTPRCYPGSSTTPVTPPVSPPVTP